MFDFYILKKDNQKLKLENINLSLRVSVLESKSISAIIQFKIFSNNSSIKKPQIMSAPISAASTSSAANSSSPAALMLLNFNLPRSIYRSSLKIKTLLTLMENALSQT